MQLQDVITRNPETIQVDDSIRSATKIMRDCQIGFLPVVDHGTVIGVVTDRDIVIRAIAGGFDPQTTKVQDIMTKDPIQLMATDSLETALETMAKWAIGRLIVTDHSGKIIGVLTSGDAATVCRGDDRAGHLTAAIHRRTHRVNGTLPPEGAQFVSD